MKGGLSTLFCVLLATINISRIKTIPRLEGLGASPVGRRCPVARALSRPSPVRGRGFRAPAASLGAALWLRPVLSPKVEQKTPFVQNKY